MKLKNKILGVLISTVILTAIAFTGIFENSLRGAVILVVLIIGFMTIIPHILEKIEKK